MTGGLLAGISGIGDAVAGFQAATAAGFTISDDGADTLIRAIDHMLNGVRDALQKADMIAQEPPLGTTPAAEVYKPFLATIATDPAQGFISAMVKFEQDLEKLRTDVEQARATYRTSDQDSRQGMTDADRSTLTA